ncbi:MAG: hypothetical protein ACYC9O_13495 [Candidatus Latescibacterota bacterium]
MKRGKILAGALAVSLAITIICAAIILVIFMKSYQDPRWRVFDYNSRQATEGEIYQVADIPAIRSVKFAGGRRLRFGFTPPVKAKSWKVVTADSGKVVSEGLYPEIPFGDSASNETYRFIPKGVSLDHDLSILISYYPKENYAKAGCSWPDNYYTPSGTMHFTLKRPHSIDEWVGLPEDDPELAEARKLLEGKVDLNAPVRERAEQVFRFVMYEIRNSGGIPTDEVLDASPLETYRFLSGGTGKGFCENRALVYYLFANSAGVKTRLVDIAGKFGPLKLTGHYFCESWLPEQASWFIADPMSAAAYVQNAKGRLLSTLDVKKLFDADNFSGCTALTYDSAGDSLAMRPIDNFYAANEGYYNDIVLAYKFGYPRNKSYSRITHFLRYPTLLYAPFPLPKLHLVKTASLAGFAGGLALSVLLILSAFVSKRTRRRGE